MEKVPHYGCGRTVHRTIEEEQAATRSEAVVHAVERLFWIREVVKRTHTEDKARWRGEGVPNQGLSLIVFPIRLDKAESLETRLS